MHEAAKCGENEVMCVLLKNSSLELDAKTNHGFR